MKISKNQYVFKKILFEENCTDFHFEEKQKSLKDYYISGLAMGCFLIFISFSIINFFQKEFNV